MWTLTIFIEVINNISLFTILFWKNTVSSNKNMLIMLTSHEFIFDELVNIFKHPQF